jgi:hypothetical protein
LSPGWANGVAAFAAPDAPLPELESPIAWAPIATAMATVPIAIELMSFRENSRNTPLTVRCG